jgi:2'-5' RNA ligase
MADTTRTFVAVAVPHALSPRLSRLQVDLADDLPAVRWVDTPPFHVTLAFLGDVPHADLARVCRAVGEAAADFAPMELALEGLGVFPNPERPRVIWSSLTGPDLESLTALQGAVAAAVAAAGYPADSQPFHPHVTLGRFKTAPRGGGKGSRAGPAPAPLSDLTKALHRRRRWSAGPFAVNEVVTFSSNLTREGPVYAPLSRARLAGKPLR